MFESIPLPQAMTVFLLEVVARILFEGRDERLAIGVLGFTAHDQTHMIGHEAVDDKCVLVLARCAQKLCVHERDTFGFDEYSSALLRAERQGVVMFSGVGDRWMMRRVGVRHAAESACRMPSFR